VVSLVQRVLRELPPLLCAMQLGCGGPAPCRVQTGCSQVAAAVRCPTDLEVVSLSEVLSGGERLIGREVIVAGPLTPGTAFCGLRVCPHGGCCNGCGANLLLRTLPPSQTTSESGYELEGPTNSLLLSGLTCHGDRSKLCCPVPGVGQPARAFGRLARSSRGVYSLQAPMVCTAAR
jgi:hypothetical protein